MPDHADIMFEGLKDAALYDYISDEPYDDVETLRQRYQRLENRLSPDGREHWLNWVMIRGETGEALGYVQATVRPGETALIAYVLFRDAWGQGFASEAVKTVIGHLFTDWSVPQLEATCDPRNLRSVALLERLGFQRTAYRSGAAEICGAVCDEVDYVLRAE